jgi:Ca-activated chloride channel family protein
MAFLWPHNLWLLLALAPLGAAYAWRMRKGRLAALASPLRQLIEEAGAARGLGRYLPTVLFAFALGVLLAAIARPSVVVALPTARPTVLLAIDVSGSMQADDVAPSRLGAAKAAARELLRTLPRQARVGIVGFTDGAYLVQAPTPDREALARAIDSLQPQSGTAIGYGILAALKALFPEERFELSKEKEEESASAGASAPAPLSRPPDFSSAIILLTDGQNTEGPEPEEAARLAAQRGIRIYTVGIGTTAGHLYRGPAADLPVGIDEGSLRLIASATGAEYFYATSAPDLRRIYAALGSKLVMERSQVEITALFCALGALVLASSALLSVLRSGRIA